VREGVLKHCSARNALRLLADEPGGPARRFVDRTQPSLEAQLCNLADEIAYNAHDIDDGVRSGLLTIEQLDDVPLVAALRDTALQEFPSLMGRRLLFETIRRMLSMQVYDVIDATAQALGEHRPANADDVRRKPPMVRFTREAAAQSATLKTFLRSNLYLHPQVVDTTERAKRVIRDLYAVYVDAPEQMPPEHAQRSPLRRSVADYIAGMTDRFALREHERLTGRRVFDDAPVSGTLFVS
jgi:dGTPase